MKSFGFVVFFIFYLPSWGAFVKNIKNNKMLIELQGQVVKPEEVYLLIDENKKKRALIKIRQVRADQAVAELLRGKANVSYQLSPEPYSTPSPTTAAPDTSEDKVTKYEPVEEENGGSWGIFGGPIQATMSVNFLPAGETQRKNTTMKGNSLSLLGFYDYPVIPRLQIRLAGGLEQLAVSGKTSGNFCDGTATCEAKITYLSLYGGGKYTLHSKSPLRIWVGGNYGFLVALSKSSNVLVTSEIQTNQIFNASLGMDYSLRDKKTYIPVSLEYGMFPSTATVNANLLIIRAGWATSF